MHEHTMHESHSPSSTNFAGYLAGLSDVELVDAAWQVQQEQQSRALKGGDVEAVADQAFDDWFSGTKLSFDPVIEHGVLLCPGGKDDKSQHAHDCSFVHVDGYWVWDYPGLLIDEVRYLPGKKTRMRSVTILPALEGLELDVVVAQLRNGQHQRKERRSFQIQRGELMSVPSRSQVPQSHR